MCHYQFFTTLSAPHALRAVHRFLRLPRDSDGTVSVNVSPALRDLLVGAQIVVYTQTEGAALTVRCSVNFVGRRRFFCKEPCEEGRVLIGPSLSRVATGTFSFGFTGSQTGRVVSVTFRQLTKADSGLYRCGSYDGISYQQIEVFAVDGEFLIKRPYSLFSQLAVRWSYGEGRPYLLPPAGVQKLLHKSDVLSCPLAASPETPPGKSGATDPVWPPCLSTMTQICTRPCSSATESVLLVVAAALCHFYLQTSSTYQVECIYQRMLANNANYANNDRGGVHLVFLICNRNAINTNLTSVPVLNSKNGKKWTLGEQDSGARFCLRFVAAAIFNDIIGYKK